MYETNNDAIALGSNEISTDQDFTCGPVKNEALSALKSAMLSAMENAIMVKLFSKQISVDQPRIIDAGHMHMNSNSIATLSMVEHIAEYTSVHQYDTIKKYVEAHVRV